MKNQNIVLDFTTNPLNNNQPLAVMPAHIAKLALSQLAHILGSVSLGTIKERLVDKIDNCKTVEDLITVTYEFTVERQLVENIVRENWDAYKVEQPKPVEQSQATFSTPRQYSGFDQESWDLLPQFAKNKFIKEWEELTLVDEREPAHTLGEELV